MSYKILAYGDAGAATGFERVQRNVLTYLQGTGHYDIILKGLGYQGEPPDVPYPYPLYPAEGRGDYFGAHDIDKACTRFKPDAVWIVNDLWNQLQYVPAKPLDIPMIGYYPVDTPNIKWSFALAAGGIACPVNYTQYGARESCAGVQEAIDQLAAGARLKKLDMDEPRSWISLPHPETEYKLNLRLDYFHRLQNLDAWPVVPHGLDRTMFRPEDRRAARREFALDEGAFIVGMVGTNQWRKQQDRAMRIFAMLAEKVPSARMLIYCNGSAPDSSGYDLHQLAMNLNIHKKIYFVHEQIQNLSEESMNTLYNCCDVMLNTSGGEGWGLTSAESSACGIAQIVPDWSASREIWSGAAELLPIIDWRSETKQLNTSHCLVDVKSSGAKLIQFATDPLHLDRYQKAALARAQLFPTWEQVGKQFEYLIRKTLGTHGPPVPYSMNQILANRKESIESELKNAVYWENGKPVKVAISD